MNDLLKDSPLYVRQSGNPAGPTVVFLHAIATSGWMWHRQAELLPDFNCLIPDLPGHGQSNRLSWNSLADTAKRVRDVIRRGSPSGQAHIVGLSLGAFVGMQLLSDSSEVVDRAILSGLNVMPLPSKRAMLVMGFLIAPIMKVGMVARANARVLKIPPDQVEDYCCTLRQMTVQAFLAASRDAVNYKMSDSLGGIKTPTLIVAGAKEHALILKSQRVLADAMPSASAAIAPNVGHGWNGEAPELFARMITTWVQGQPLPDGLLPITPTT